MVDTAKEDTVEFATCPPRVTIVLGSRWFRNAPLRSPHKIVTLSDPI
jgi:hypothetical protein